mgnify:CR=1 FL=1
MIELIIGEMLKFVVLGISHEFVTFVNGMCERYSRDAQEVGHIYLESGMCGKISCDIRDLFFG